MSLVTSIALALEKHRDIVQRQAAMDAVSIELESLYRQLFNQQTEVLRLGSILATVLDDDRRRAISSNSKRQWPTWTAPHNVSST